jgi:MFS family permease
VGVVLFQSLFNCFFAAFGAVAADRTPDAQKGLLSSLLSLGLPIGSAIGVFVVGGLILDSGARYAALGVMVAAAILPFLLFQRDPTAAPGATANSTLANQEWRPRSRNDFFLALSGRVLTLTSHALLQGFGLFLLQDRWSHLRGAPAQVRPEQALAMLLAGSTCVHIAAALFSGWLSDKVRRRKPFIILGAIGSGAAIACAAMAQDWNGMILAFLVFGIAAGCYCAVDSALMLQVLPSLETAGRDLGVVNLTNTIPQALAPMLAVAVMHQGHTAYGPLLLIGAAVATAGAATIIPIRNVR